MTKSGRLYKLFQSDQIFSWVMLVCFVLYINLSLFLMLVKKPEVKDVNEEVMKRRIAKLIMKADFDDLDFGESAWEKSSSELGPGEGKADVEGEEEEPEKVEEPEKTGEDEGETGDAGEAGGRAKDKTDEEVRNHVRNVGLLAELTGKGKSNKAGSGASTSVFRNQDLEKNFDNVLSGLDGVRVAKAGEMGNLANRGLVQGGGGGGDELVSLFKEKASAKEDVNLEREGTLELSGPGPIKGAGSKSSYRSAKQINEVVRSHLGSLEYCYNRRLKRNPNLQGRIVIQFTIKADGTILDCKVVESSMEDRNVEQCLVRSISRWNFPGITEGSTEITYPFMFFPEH